MRLQQTASTSGTAELDKARRLQNQPGSKQEVNAVLQADVT